MLINIFCFLGGILFFGLIAYFGSRHNKKIQSDLMMVAFEKKNGIIKATVANSGKVYLATETGLASNAKNWWLYGDKNKPGIFEESLTHLYFTNELKNSFNREVSTPTNQPPVKPTKFN